MKKIRTHSITAVLCLFAVCLGAYVPSQLFGTLFPLTDYPHFGRIRVRHKFENDSLELSVTHIRGNKYSDPSTYFHVAKLKQGKYKPVFKPVFDDIEERKLIEKFFTKEELTNPFIANP